MGLFEKFVDGLNSLESPKTEAQIKAEEEFKAEAEWQASSQAKREHVATKNEIYGWKDSKVLRELYIEVQQGNKTLKDIYVLLCGVVGISAAITLIMYLLSNS